MPIFDFTERNLLTQRAMQMSGKFGTDTGVIIKNLGDAEKGVYKFKVTQLATKTYFQSYSPFSERIKSTATFKYANINPTNKEFYIKYNNVKYKFITKNTYASITELFADFTEQANDMIGDDLVRIEYSSSRGNLTMHVYSTEDIIPVTVLSAENSDKDFLKEVNVPNGSTTGYDLNMSIYDAMGEGAFIEANTDTFVFTINNVSLSCHRDDTIQDVINTINNSAADVTMRYSNGNQRFILENNKSGTFNLTLGGSEYVWALLFNMNPQGASTLGKNAIVTFTTPSGDIIENMELTSNTFIYNNALITLLHADNTKTYVAVL